ncbi:Hypothetical protein, putative [Bodo saltans]|uniref:Uncharacterized protein n=1 Tax=Bodo saltans TaxID=75058 RepID=A0A0S4JS13_BODSA|nr:Hypothetical protein, putative [Bodo saltans]|eukprot:CUG91309.1 Hypothetical protein, putative [Bodo saltans]
MLFVNRALRAPAGRNAPTINPYLAFQTVIRDMELENPTLSSSDQLASTPPLTRPFRIPLHADLPQDSWRREARAGVARAVSPVTRQFPQFEEFLAQTDWPLACLLHPTAVPKGPLRTAFAMPQAVSTHGSSWLSLAWQVCALERKESLGSEEEVLLRWMKKSSLESLVIFNNDVFVPSDDSAARREGDADAVPPVVIIPSAICLLGMVWRETGDTGAALLLDQMR